MGAEGGVRIGAIVPQWELGNDRGAIRAWAQAARDLGFGHVLIFEHVLGADPSGRPGWRGLTHEIPFHEPLTLGGFIAAAAPGLEIATGVLVLPQRQTALVAKQAATLDILAAGRLRLGVGVGWNRVEYAGLGQPFGARGRRCDEQIRLLRRLWTEPAIAFAGDFDRIDRAGIAPPPRQRPIPIWIGGDSAAAEARVALLGDGWLLHGDPDAALVERIARVRRSALAAGRHPDAIGVEGRASLASGGLDGLARTAERWRAMPWVSHLGIDFMGAGIATADGHVAALAGCAEAVGLGGAAAQGIASSQNWAWNSALS
jgi:probable F420-dependent oxidoreductase